MAGQAGRYPPSGYRNGDFDYSGSVDASDYFLIDCSFLAKVAHQNAHGGQNPPPLAAKAAVPVLGRKAITHTKVISINKASRQHRTTQRGRAAHADRPHRIA